VLWIKIKQPKRDAIAREAEKTADFCRSANAVVKVVQADIAIDEDCRRLAAAASEWGRLDILVNNASATKHVANPPISMRSRRKTFTAFMGSTLSVRSR
jgi:NAD(P)-dependent dehydrogenase (short-subunit alcohol dehydrogenase family)